VAVFREKQHPQPPIAYQNMGAAPAPAAAAADSARAEADSPVVRRYSKAGAAADREVTRMDEAARLGTGHGAREYAPIRYTEFERESPSPDQIVKLRYDSRANLMARGIIPAPVPCPPEPQPFPGGFVPDPRG